MLTDCPSPEKVQGKSVAFFELVGIKRIVPYYEYSDDEHDATWYSEDQLREVVSECVATCRMMTQGEPILEEEGLCSRGLEFKTPSGSRFKREAKARARQVVIEECETQKRTKIHDPEYLAMVYAVATKDTRHMACLMALRDEEDAISSSSPPKLLRDKKIDLDPSSSEQPVSDSEMSDSSNLVASRYLFIEATTI